jgi:hypothetical protein
MERTQLINAALDFMDVAQHYYGVEPAQRMFEHMTANDPVLAQEMFLRLLAGRKSSSVQVVGIDRQKFDRVACVRAIRMVTGWALKEAIEVLKIIDSGQSVVLKSKPGDRIDRSLLISNGLILE